MTAGYKSIECEAWENPYNDVIYIKLRRRTKLPNGNIQKEGVILKFTEEILFNEIPEGSEYPHQALDNRYISIVRELTKEEEISES